MGKNLKKQADKKFPLWVDESTHRLFSQFAASRGKKINSALKDVIYSNPGIKRFMGQNTQSLPTMGECTTSNL
jgi:predicted HicB family RNase H-like nuclease